jgi:hypothetical protein
MNIKGMIKNITGKDKVVGKLMPKGAPVIMPKGDKGLVKMPKDLNVKLPKGKYVTSKNMKGM